MSDAPYKVFRRPSLAISDDEGDDDQKTTDYKNTMMLEVKKQIQSLQKQVKENKKNIAKLSGIEEDRDDERTKGTEKSLFLWLEWHSGQHYIGCFGQQSYSYATPNDIIVAYNYMNIDKEWFFWILDINKLSPAQFLWIQKENAPQFKHLVNDPYLLKQIGLTIKRELTVDPQCEIKLKPFVMTKPTAIVIDKIKSNINNPKMVQNITTYVAKQKWAEIFANKSCLHRFINNLKKPSPFEACNVYAENDGLTECKGYVCTNKKEVLMAFDKLTKELGRNRVVIKDCFGASGDDISFWNSRQEIQDKFEWREEFKYIEVEEDLRYNDAEIEKVEFVGISFYDNQVIGGGHEQIILDEAVFGGSKTYTNKKMEEVLKKVATKVMRKIGTKFMGGFDFAIQWFKDKNIKPKVYLIDMNTARYTATIQTFIVMKKFGIKDRYFIRKSLKIKKDASFKQVIESNPEILYDTKSKTGAYFHVFYPGSNTGIVSIFGVDEKDANERLKKLSAINYLC